MFRHVGQDCLNKLILIVFNGSECSNLFTTNPEGGRSKPETFDWAYGKVNIIELSWYFIMSSTKMG